MGRDIAKQASDIYAVPFYNGSGSTMPAFGVGLLTAGANVSDQGLFIPAVDSSASDKVVGMLVNGPTAVTSGSFGSGYVGQGPVLALYDTADGSPLIGETWGIKSGGTAFTLNKGYMGFTVASSVTAGSGSASRCFVTPAWHVVPPIVGYLRGSSITITDADSDIRVVPLNSAGGNMVRGVWPSYTMPLTLDIDTSGHTFTVRRAGFWKIRASWTSYGSPRYSSPFQSKVHRVDIAVYVNGSRASLSGGISHYFHISLANADTSPTSGIAIPTPASINTGMYLAAGDVVDLRVSVSEVTADSGTTAEGYIYFSHCDMMMEFVGSQQWRTDY